MTNTSTSSLTLSVAEAADLLGIGRATLYHLIAVGDFPALHLGQRLRVSRVEVERRIAAATTTE